MYLLSGIGSAEHEGKASFMPPIGFQRTQIPNEMATPRVLKLSPTGKLAFLVITHVLFYKMPSWPEQEVKDSSHAHTKKKTATKWCMTCDGASGDLKVVGRGWNDGAGFSPLKLG